MTDLEARVERLEALHGIYFEDEECDYSDFEDEDEELDFFAEQCRCGAIQDLNGRLVQVADCCC